MCSVVGVKGQSRILLMFRERERNCLFWDAGEKWEKKILRVRRMN